MKVLNNIPPSKQGNFQLSNTTKHTSFKAKTELIKEGVDFFIRNNSGSEPNIIRNMFLDIAEYLKTLPTKNLQFYVQPEKNQSINIFSEIIDARKFNVLFDKYKSKLTPKEIEKIEKNHVMFYMNINRPLEIYKKPILIQPNQFTPERNFDKAIIADVKNSIQPNDEEQIFLSMFRRKCATWRKIYDWLDHHGPDTPPVY